MLRHRGAIAAAGALVVGVMVLSAIDLKAMDESKARIDRNFKITLLPKQPELPANVRYCENDDQNGTEGMIPVTESSWAEAKQGFVDAHGKVVIPIVFENVYFFSEGLAAVQDPKTHKWGFIDKSGKYVIQPQYESYAKFHQGVAAVVVKNKGGRLIDKTGRVVFARGKSTIEELVPGLFVVTAANNRVGLIDKAGKLIVPMEFDSIAKINANDVQHELYSPLFVII